MMILQIKMTDFLLFYTLSLGFVYINMHSYLIKVTDMMISTFGTMIFFFFGFKEKYNIVTLS